VALLIAPWGFRISPIIHILTCISVIAGNNNDPGIYLGGLGGGGGDICISTDGGLGGGGGDTCISTDGGLGAGDWTIIVVLLS
jgi:hypothetical protein